MSLRENKIIVVGERMNYHKRWTPTICAGDEYAFSLRKGLGAFRFGTAKKRLLDAGLCWDTAINLLMPSHVLGEWDIIEAKRIVTLIKKDLCQYDVMILLGRKVTEAFGLKFCPYSCNIEIKPKTIILPHPSGRNRTWNKNLVKIFIDESFK